MLLRLGNIRTRCCSKRATRPAMSHCCEPWECCARSTVPQSGRGGRSVNPALFMDLRARFTFHDRSEALRSETILLRCPDREIRLIVRRTRNEFRDLKDTKSCTQFVWSDQRLARTNGLGPRSVAGYSSETLCSLRALLILTHNRLSRWRRARRRERAVL